MRNLALVFFVLFATSSNAVSSLTVRTLFDLCTRDGNTGSAVCGAYMLGYRDGFVASQNTTGSICLPPTLSGDQVRDIFVKAIQTYGEGRLSPELSANADIALATFMSAAFPCRKK
jgi:hypothetical protein